MQLKIQQNVALAPYTTYGTGGPARYFAVCDHWEKIFHAREFAKKEGLPYMLLGGGSNVLIADEGYPGLVILNSMTKATFQKNKVIAESGVNVTKLVLLAAKQGLGGISGLINVPGTIGGAVYGNAGVPDVWIGDVLTEAVVLPNNGNKPVVMKNKDFKFGYRTSILKQTKDIVLSATLKLKTAKPEELKLEIQHYTRERTAKQPIGRCCGSFFKNPGDFPSAGWLLDQAGCKGMKVGDAEISEKHANFFMNKGHATSTDILELAKKAHKMVKEKFDVHMEPEVQIIPENPFK